MYIVMELCDQLLSPTETDHCRSQSRSQSGRSSPLAHELMYGIMHGRDPSAAVSEAPSDATFLANARGHTDGK